MLEGLRGVSQVDRVTHCRLATCVETSVAHRFSVRRFLTFPVNLRICRHEFGPDIGPRTFDLETR